MTSDKTLLRNRFAASFRKYDTLAVVQDKICGQLTDMLTGVCPPETEPGVARHIKRALEIGAGTGFLTRRLLRSFPYAHWTVNDLAEEAAAFIVPYAGGTAVDYLWGDAETIALPGELDLIASASTLQWFDDLPAFLTRSGELMNPGGCLALSTFGPENFREIKAVTGEGLSYYVSAEVEELLKWGGWQVMEKLEYTEQLSFDSPVEVLRHIKATGVNSIRKTQWGRRQLTDFETCYRAMFSTIDNKVTLTYHPVLIVATR